MSFLRITTALHARRAAISILAASVALHSAQAAAPEDYADLLGTWN